LKMRQAYKKYKNLFSTKEFNKKKLVHSVEWLIGCTERLIQVKLYNFCILPTNIKSLLYERRPGVHYIGKIILI
jgi:hypothetical protein